MLDSAYRMLHIALCQVIYTCTSYTFVCIMHHVLGTMHYCLIKYPTARTGPATQAPVES